MIHVYAQASEDDVVRTMSDDNDFCGLVFMEIVTTLDQDDAQTAINDLSDGEKWNIKSYLTELANAIEVNNHE